jgi:hypothetical protein
MNTALRVLLRHLTGNSARHADACLIQRKAKVHP